jgi:hypothetical protein
VDWNRVLIPNAPLKLLYSLNLIDKYVAAGIAATTGPTSAEREWCDAFLRKGGVAHLIKVLMTCDVDALLASALPKSCLILTLKLVRASFKGAAFPMQGGRGEGWCCLRVWCAPSGS